MAVKRRPTDDDDGGLDSLLDTMTNVVGILVLVLIVTQMSVAEVVTKITSESTIDEESLEELSKQLEIRKTEEDELKQILVDPLDIDVEKQREELQKKKELLERRKKLLEEKQKEKNDYAMKVESDRELAKKNEKEVEDTKAKRKQLETLITSALEKKASLEAMLDKTPRVATPADIEVSIPNPRPAPEGAKQFALLCWEDRLYPMNIDAVRKDAEAKVKGIIARFKLDQDPVKGIDPAKFTKYYERMKEQDDFFNYEYYVDQERYPRIRLVPREGRGASASEVKKLKSRFRTKYLNQVDPRKYYARFYVLPDSYNVYATARRVFTDYGMLAGWDPQNQDYQFTSWVPGGIELGPPRKKEPPKPPTTPRKPANLID
jgi:hypothetical protein